MLVVHSVALVDSVTEMGVELALLEISVAEETARPEELSPAVEVSV